MRAQRFDDVPHDRRAANICLYYGKDEEDGRHLGDAADGRSMGRMGYVEWRQGYPVIHAKLSPAEPGLGRLFVLKGPLSPKPFEPRPFVLCPTLPKSFVSEQIAENFRLTVIPGMRRFYPVVDVFSGKTTCISSALFVSASVTVECNAGISPRPIPGNVAFDMVVLPGVPEDLAIFGRDVLDYMLLLYRGGYGKNAVESEPGLGRLYFGRDTRE